MNYRLKAGENNQVFEIENIQEGKFDFFIKKDKGTVEYLRINDNQITFRLNGKMVNAYLLPGSEPFQVIIDGVAFYIEDEDKAGSGKKRKKGSTHIPMEITPPMPSVIMKVLVENGSKVSKGDGIVVVSAMKMETTLNAPFDGIVTSINTVEGEKVMPGDILVDIEKDVKEEVEE
jgi:acetyl/propionyl-CoA carboxylase alpha subunit